MQSCGNDHHRVSHSVLPVAEFVRDDATALHAPHHVLNPHFFAGNTTVLFLLFGCKRTTAWFLGWLLDGYVCDSESLKAHVLIQDATRRQAVHFIIDQ